MSLRRTFVPAVLAVLAVWACIAALPQAAAAHAQLKSSDPAAGATLASSPSAVTLTFTEAVDPNLSLVKVVDARGVSVPGVSPARLVPGGDVQLKAVLAQTLPRGVYTVNWLSVSADDGHVEDGAFAFGVGEKPAPGSAVVVPLSHASSGTDALGAVGRWLLYAGLVLMVGAASTSLLVFGGRLPGGGVPVLRAAALAGVVGLAIMVWTEKILVGVPRLLPLFQTREGELLLVLGIALLVCIGAVVAVDFWPARWSLWLLGAAGATAMLAHVLAGHAASGSSFWLLNTAVQWGHLTAVGVWIGGLFWLLLGLRGADAAARGAAVGRFVTIATVTLAVVLATGLARALVEVGSFGALFSSSYGVTLVVKLILVAGLVTMGAVNHFRWAPAVRRGEPDPAPRRFGLNSRGELVVALCVLAATAVLSGLAPVP